MMGPRKRRRNKHGDDDGVARTMISVTRTTGFLYIVFSPQYSYKLRITRITDAMSYIGIGTKIINCMYVALEMDDNKNVCLEIRYAKFL